MAKCPGYYLKVGWGGGGGGDWNRLKEGGLMAVCCKHGDKPLVFVRC